MVLFMKENLKKINKKEKEKKNGQMVLFMKVSIKMELNVEKVNLFGIMVPYMKGISIIIKLMGLVLILFLMGENIMEIGKIIK